MAKIKQKAVLTYEIDDSIDSIQIVLNSIAEKFPRSRVLGVYTPARQSTEHEEGVKEITIEVSF